MSKKTLVYGTIILTSAGLLTRFMGFFYKIYLSRAMGAEMLGIYQLVFPVYAICFTLYASGIQTAISKLIAEGSGRKVLKNGCIMSVSSALFLSVLLFLFSRFIAETFLLEPRCYDSLRVLCFVFPFCGITSCINGYYYGLKKTTVPAITQIIEQIFRIICVYICAYFLPVSCELAIIGIVAGEIASCLFNVISLKFKLSKTTCNFDNNLASFFRPLLLISLPLSANRLLINLLHAFESVLFPLLLRRNGMTSSMSLSILGILNGMSMPLLMFPGAVIGSLSVLLLPEISEAAAQGNKEKISKTIIHTLEFTSILGIMFMTLFIFFGNELGALIYNEPRAGKYLASLAWLCPFVYITTTLSSILNGLGKAYITFINSIISSLIRLILMIILIPVLGIYGYFIAELIGQLLSALLDLIAVRRNIFFSFNALNGIVKPALICLLNGALFKKLFEFIDKNTHIPQFSLLLGICVCFCMTFIIFNIIINGRSIRQIFEMNRVHSP